MRGTQRKGLGVAVIAATVLAAATVRAIAPATPMASVPGGTFPMGCDSSRASERPRHLVRVAAFAIDATEVTVRDYDGCVFARACKPSGLASGETSLCNDARTRPDHPANCVDWDDAHAFCAWAGKRLPTEEEWEYAARGADERAYPWGDVAPMTNMVNALGEGDGFAATSPVATYDAGRSPFGVYDMAGNVWEWTADRYDASYYATAPSVNPAGPVDGGERVIRGGGFDAASIARFVRASARAHADPESTGAGDSQGFRCAQ